MNVDAITESLDRPAVQGAARPAHARTAAEADDAPATRAAVREAVLALQSATTGLQFKLDESSGKLVVMVLDAATKEVLRQIPSPEAIAISRALSRTQSALLQTRA